MGQGSTERVVGLLSYTKEEIGETPFSMTYGAEVAILMEINLSSMMVASFSLGSNDAQMIEWLDLLEKS